MIEENSEEANLVTLGARFVVPIRDVIAVLIRGWKTLAVAFCAPVALSLIGAAALPRSYDSEARLLVLPDRQYTGQTLGTDDAPNRGIDSEQISKIEMEILGSRELKLAVAAALGPHVIDSSLSPDLAKGPAYDRALNSAADRLDKAIDVQSDADSSIIHVRFSNRDPKVASDGLAKLVSAYLARRQDIFNRDGLPFLLAKRDEAAALLESARGALAGFRQAHDIVDLPDQITLLLDELTRLKLAAMQARETVAQRGAETAALSAVSAQLPGTVMLTDEHEAESESGNSRSILLGLQLRRQELLSKYADTSHFITDIDQQIAALKSFEDSNDLKSGRDTATGANPVVQELRDDIRSFEQDRAGAESRGQENDRQADAVQQRLLELTSLEPEDRRLLRAVALADDQYKMLSKFYEEAMVGEAVDRQSTANVRVIETSNPINAHGSRRLVVGLGILSGLAAVILTALVTSAFREIMLTPSAAARTLRMPVVARVANRELKF